MTDSFFLIHLIDKMEYYGINALYTIPHDLFIKGRAQYKGDTIYIQNIEPKPEGNAIFEFGSESVNSLWLGVGIIPKETFEENVELYKDLCRWIMDFLYLSRFFVNLNLKARVFFHVENYNEENIDSKLSFQRIIDINCYSGSTFQVKYNKYDLLLPLLTKLLQYNPTEKLRAIMYNYACSKHSNSGVTDYFFNFATFEGIVHNWAEFNGYSELWGTAIANPSERDDIHEKLSTHFTQLVNNNDFEGEKLNQLNSFKDSTFPLDRKIRRTLKQQFKSYYNTRLTDELREKKEMKKLLRNFQRIYSRRNEIGHSLDTYLGSTGLIEDINTLFSTIKIIMDFELSKFLNGDIDWKFEIRPNSLKNNMKQMTQEKVLHKFNYDVKVQNQDDIQLIDRFGTINPEKVEFHSRMIKQNDIDDEDLTNLIFSQNLKIRLPQNYSRRTEQPQELGIVNAYKDPYWWLSTTHGNSHYIIKVFPPTRITFASNREVHCEIFSESILSVIKLDLLDIPDDLDIFAFKQ